ncbi:MAG: hypothetical protein AAB874_02740 [Patescibacteria group bacterium]
MYQNQRYLSKPTGFTMVETLVAIGVLGIFFAAFVMIFGQVLNNIGESRVRAVALSLAQSKMEIVRNLPYAAVGIVGGIPGGPLLPNELVTINNLPFTITTSVIYLDDPFDNLAPSDLVNTDYKRVRIEITWEGAFPSRKPVTLVTNIAPKGVETIAGGGTLMIRVFNALGQPVQNATVNIDNTVVNPQIHLQTLADTNGLVVLPGAPACITCYKISATKSGYSTDRTYSSMEVANPLQPYITVIEGQVTPLSFAIDIIGKVIINSYGSRESGFPPISNVAFTIRGSKIIGTTSSDDPVYKYQYSTNTGGGSVEITGLEWDTYTLDFTNSGHNLAGANPAQPFALLPGANMTLPIVAVPKGANTVLVVLQNSQSQLIGTGSAQLTNASISYEATKAAGATAAADMGQTFFGGLSPIIYQLKVIADGYQEATTSVSVTGNVQENITLSPVQ